MDARSTTALMSRAQYVVVSTDLFMEALANKLSLKDLEEFANGAEKMVREMDHEMTEYLMGDEDALTNHAVHVRILAGKIVLLRDGLVPALRIDQNNPVIRMFAIRSMGYIRAECEAMMCLLR